MEVPYNEDAEMHVLSAILIDNKVISKATAIIEPSDFYSDKCAKVFISMILLAKEGKNIEPVTLAPVLKKAFSVDEIKSFLQELLMFSPSSSTIKQYASIVKEMSVLRNVLKEVEKVKEAVMNQESIEAIKQKSSKIFTSINFDKKREPKSIHDCTLEAGKTVMQTTKTGKPRGYGTGFEKTDRLIGGCIGGRLVVTAADPGCGKSSYSLQKALNTAAFNDKPVFFFSLEMKNEEQGSRMLANVGEIDITDILMRGKKVVNIEEKIQNTLRSVDGVNLFIDDSSRSLDEILMSIQSLKLKHGNPSLVVIDYLQIIKRPRKSTTNDEISEITGKLKSLAMDMNCEINILSQLNRQKAQRENKDPILSDLRDSGAIEQDADVVMFIFKPTGCTEDESAIRIAKHRGGAKGEILLKWEGKNFRFTEKNYPSNNTGF